MTEYPTVAFRFVLIMVIAKSAKSSKMVKQA